MKHHFMALLVMMLIGYAQPQMAQSQESQRRIQGVWRVVDYTAAGVTHHLDPAFWIFSGKHYAMLMDTRDDVKRPNLENPDSATAQQLLAAWGPFAAQFGSYEIKGDVLTLQILAAKNSEIVGTKRLQRIKLEGNTLTTEALRTEDGQPLSKPVILRMERLE